MWKKIPDNILNDIHTLNEYTANSGKESTLTACGNQTHVYTANASGGEDGSVESLTCDKRFGKTQRIADIHTHPHREEASGLTPSHADLAVNLAESYDNNKKQISCITNKQSPLIICNQSKRVPNRAKVNQYIKAEVHDGNFYRSDFHRKNVPKDFTTAFFDPATGNQVQPSDEAITQTMFGASLPAIKRENWSDSDRKEICSYMADINAVKNRKNLTSTCSQMLKSDSVQDTSG